ncbi:hypothetical protein [Acinetobacter ursingii]|uniref:hypothetical protein n=1 Tax=Acinetobacter ursingii TaxID=108980 RepID=UPI00249C9932|nr:hypothetical protein [Acinetobacter ursingii]MDI3236754.1 hypothetical protein [Acinetobacter ursingii]
MNMFHKPERFAASFPELAVANEFYIQNNLVYFTLTAQTNWPIFVAGVIEASEKEDTFEYAVSLDVQENIDVSYDYLEVDTQCVAVVDNFSEYEVSNGMKFKLTEAQAQKLNEWLKEHAIDQKLKELKGCAA